VADCAQVRFPPSAKVAATTIAVSAATVVAQPTSDAFT
jgi:hypothetical protein